MRSLCLVMSLAILAMGCAQKPEEEMAQAEAALADARQAAGSQWAQDDLRKARETVAEGKRLVDEGEYEAAKTTFEEAARLADVAEKNAVDAKRQAEEEARRQAEEKRKAEAEPVVKTSHQVVQGECLWYIAGYDDVYGDPAQWMKIYRANQDKIRDPDLIYPDQVFTIPR